MRALVSRPCPTSLGTRYTPSSVTDTVWKRTMKKTWFFMKIFGLLYLFNYAYTSSEVPITLDCRNGGGDRKSISAGNLSIRIWVSKLQSQILRFKTNTWKLLKIYKYWKSICLRKVVDGRQCKCQFRSLILAWPWTYVANIEKVKKFTPLRPGPILDGF